MHHRASLVLCARCSVCSCILVNFYSSLCVYAYHPVSTPHILCASLPVRLYTHLYLCACISVHHYRTNDVCLHLSPSIHTTVDTHASRDFCSTLYTSKYLAMCAYMPVRLYRPHSIYMHLSTSVYTTICSNASQSISTRHDVCACASFRL